MSKARDYLIRDKLKYKCPCEDCFFSACTLVGLNTHLGKMHPKVPKTLTPKMLAMQARPKRPAQSIARPAPLGKPETIWRSIIQHRIL